MIIMNTQYVDYQILKNRTTKYSANLIMEGYKCQNNVSFVFTKPSLVDFNSHSLSLWGRDSKLNRQDAINIFTSVQ